MSRAQPQVLQLDGVGLGRRLYQDPGCSVRGLAYPRAGASPSSYAPARGGSFCSRGRR
jgi:hypothetical protein